MTTLDGVTVTLRFFAVYRERVGSDCIEVTLPNGATVDDALRCLAEEHPATVPLLPTTMVAVNQVYVERSHLLQSMDEVALIPPCVRRPRPTRAPTRASSSRTSRWTPKR